jgi:hypothetical protein
MPDKAQSVLRVTSPAFDEGGMIPPRHSPDGENVSPALAWQGVPEGTRSLVLLLEDPYIRMGDLCLYAWVHWIVYNIPPDASSLPEAVPDTATLAGGARQGTTSFGKPGYGGPAPLMGTRRYYFRVYALDTTLDALDPQRATKRRVLKAMNGHILAQGLLTGIYRKKR